MPKVYAAFAGNVLVGTYGVATDDDPVIVPESVAAELEKCSKVRVERDTPAPKRPGRKPKEEG